LCTSPHASKLTCFRPKPPSIIAAPDMSRCVLLKNCFNPAEESGNAWVKELEDDVKLECEQKYGKVLPPSTFIQPLGESHSRRRRLEW
jgi:linker between RRM2 and RRM3 domains in RBM39 protein